MNHTAPGKLAPVLESLHSVPPENDSPISPSSREKPPLEGIVATSPVMQKLCRAVHKVAPTELSCTLLGESGTGKEVFARAIHRLSARCDQRFMAINCASVPESLIESELFGHEKGAFTGAHALTRGRIECADRGTLFLDEIGDMPLNLQAKLLRFLQERAIERVGGRTEIAVDVRVICATNKNLESMVEAGSFREDLYYRIGEMVLKIPPLRERENDKQLLARFFIEQFARQQGVAPINLSKGALCAIESHTWPGNVREMENRLKRALIMAETASITESDMGLNTGDYPKMTLREVRRRAEQTAIVKALSINRSNISATARFLGVTRPTLYDLMKKYDLNTLH